MGKEHVTILRFALDRLFESSVYLDAAGLKHMIQSLGVLAIESMSRVEFASPRESPVTVGYGNSSVRAKRKDQESRGGYVSAAFLQFLELQVARQIVAIVCKEVTHQNNRGSHGAVMAKKVMAYSIKFLLPGKS